MEKELTELIEKKEYRELTVQEKEHLSEWCSSEEEFEQLKLVFRGVETMKRTSQERPRPEVKASLDDLFMQHRRTGTPTIWYNSLIVTLYPQDKPLYRRPLVQIAAAGLLALLVSPLFFMDDLSSDKVLTAGQEVMQPKRGEKVIQPEKELQDETVATEQPTVVSEPENGSPSNSPSTRDMISDADAAGSVPVAAMQVADDVYSFTVPGISSKGVSTGSAFVHPDGIFAGASGVAYSQSADEQPAVLDLLTAAF